MFPDPVQRKRLIESLEKEIFSISKKKLEEYMDKLEDKLPESLRKKWRKIKEAVMGNCVECFHLNDLEELLRRIEDLIWCCTTYRCDVVETSYAPHDTKVVTPRRAVDGGDRYSGEYAIYYKMYQTWDSIRQLPRMQCDVYITRL